MAKKLLTNLDLNKNELQNARTQNLAAPPGAPVAGLRYHDTLLLSEHFYNGTSWVPCDARLRNGIPITNLATDPLARGNHTGTQVASTISDLATVVQTYRLDQFAMPTASVAFNGQKITGLGTPTAGSNDAARIVDVENAVQSSAAGIDSKPSVRVVSVANIATLSGLPTIDGITLLSGERILLTGQTTSAQNGPYSVAAGAWSRVVDADQTGEVTPGAFWMIEEGTLYNKTQWRCGNSGAITLGTTAITITQFGAASMYTGGAGLVLTGVDFSVGQGAGIIVADDTVSIDTAVVVRKYAATIGDGAATSITVTHSLNTQDVTYSIREVATNSMVDCDVQANGVNTVVLTFASAPANNSLRVVVHG